MAKTRTRVSIASVGKALSRALGLLARRPYTERALREKLKAFPEKEVEEAIQRLREWGYLDDEAFVQSFVAAKKSRYGPHRLRHELLRRGASEEVIERHLPKDEEELAYALLSRHAARYREDEARAVRFLVGRGFSLSAALAAFRRLRRGEGEG